jgi:hypothetical protein
MYSVFSSSHFTILHQPLVLLFLNPNCPSKMINLVKLLSISKHQSNIIIRLKYDLHSLVLKFLLKNGFINYKILQFTFLSIKTRSAHELARVGFRLKSFTNPIQSSLKELEKLLSNEAHVVD